MMNVGGKRVMDKWSGEKEWGNEGMEMERANNNNN
jgi:hypothetical protein